MRIGLYFVVSLILLDVVIGSMFQGDAASPRDMSRPEQFLFEGRSVESKLRTMASFSASPRSAMRSGWVDDVYARAERVPGARADAARSTVYGLSFSNQLGRALAGIDAGLDVRLISGPAAPLSHSVYAYERDPEAAELEVVVLGILLDQLPALLSMHEGGVTFRLPHAYQYPRYIPDEDAPGWVEPVLRRYADFEAALAEPQRWAAFRDQLAAHDAYFGWILFDGTVFDRSFVVGLARRSWARHRQQDVELGWASDSGSEVLTTARALLSRFADLAGERGHRAVVILFNARGNAAAERALAAHLEAEHVLYVRSTPICPATDARNFVSDGHFSERCNAALARAVAERLALVR
jgi:hypothetical protein